MPDICYEKYEIAYRSTESNVQQILVLYRTLILLYSPLYVCVCPFQCTLIYMIYMFHFRIYIYFNHTFSVAAFYVKCIFTPKLCLIFVFMLCILPFMIMNMLHGESGTVTVSTIPDNEYVTW